MLPERTGPFNRVTMRNNSRSSLQKFDTMDQFRPLRTKSGDMSEFDCSSKSLLTGISRFVGSMKSMNSVVLIPSRLRDVAVDQSDANSADLFQCYEMLQQMEKELLWGSNATLASTSLTQQQQQQQTVVIPEQQHNKKDWSLVTGSCGASEADSESEYDSMMSDSQYSSAGSSCSGSSSPQRIQINDNINKINNNNNNNNNNNICNNCSNVASKNQQHLSIAFKYHLQGLQTILHQLADTADTVVAGYQREVEPSSSSSL